ncbi:MAG: phosphodiester glycosidase family protein [Leptolyngbya sp. SIO4C1]|nr:phosphodiester glycosidase family protein [Leptolyngbya sp. SIO4C1]
MRQSLEEFEEKASSDQATSCVFSVRYFYELLISPLNDERTLIHMGLTDEGYVVDDLIGSVRITLPGNPATAESIELNAGDRFFFDYLIDSFEKQPKEAIPNSERQRAANYPIVKTFLDTNKWPPGLESEIEAYRRELQQQFLPPVSAEQVNLAANGRNYQLWKASVSLSNPNVAFSLVRDCTVNGENSFRRFAESQQAALVMGGIFSRQNRCDPTTFPLYSEGVLVEGSAQDWTKGTVFSIRSSDQEAGLIADMQTYNAGEAYSWSSSQPDWSNYLFAVTSGPRLLADGQVVYSRQAARDQGHGDRFIINETEETRRAALCLSSDKKQFHYVLLQEPAALNLAEFSNVLRSSDVGCWDAVNLDGGGGPALAVDGDVKHPPGREQPYLIVVYYAESAPSRTRSVWGLP